MKEILQNALIRPPGTRSHDEVDAGPSQDVTKKPAFSRFEVWMGRRGEHELFLFE